MERHFEWKVIWIHGGLLPNSAPARLNRPFRFKNILSKSAVSTPMLSRPAEAPTKTGAEIHPKPSSIHVEIASLALKIDLDDISVHVSQCFKQTSPHSRQMPLGPIMDPCHPQFWDAPGQTLKMSASRPNVSKIDNFVFVLLLSVIFQRNRVLDLARP